jgi:hypothetical protein
MNENPWVNLPAPGIADTMSAQRVDAENPWGFFWARGIENEYMLVLTHKKDSMPQGRLPKLKGIELTVADENTDSDRILIFKLLDSAYIDIFFRLCTDIVCSAVKAEKEKEAVGCALARTWRWHHLLRGGGDGRLSPEEQKGLIGELFVMEKYLLPNLTATNAISAWQGPLGAPKDFELGRICVEAKARRSGSAPFVAISSEHQLDDADIDALFLHVVALDNATPDNGSKFSLTDVASRVKKEIESASIEVVDEFDGKLIAAGFNWGEDYSDSLWQEGQSRVYKIEDGFPRITAQAVSSGVSNVKYAIDLSNCEPFIVSAEELTDMIRG